MMFGWINLRMSYRCVSVGRLALALSLGLPLAVASTTVRPAYAQVVSRIIVEGNQRVEAERWDGLVLPESPTVPSHSGISG